MDENLSGAFDYERQRFDDEHGLLRADPAFGLWLDSLKLEKERENDRPERNEL